MKILKLDEINEDYKVIFVNDKEEEIVQSSRITI